MHTVDLIRQTLDALFVQYRNYNKNSFALSLNVLLIICVATAVMAIPILLLMDFLGVGLYDVTIWDQMYYPESMYRIRLQNFAYAINVFGMAIFGYYLLRNNPENTPLKSTRDVFDHVPSPQMPLLLMLLGGFLLFYIITFPYLFDFNFGNTGMFDAYVISSPEYLSFLHWFDSLFELLKSYVPLLLAFLLLVGFYEGKLQTQGIKKYRSAMLAAFVLLFVFDSAWVSVSSLFRTYFTGLISLPFPQLLIPTLIGFFAELALLAFFTLANAFVLVYPFYSVHQQSQEKTME